MPYSRPDVVSGVTRITKPFVDNLLDGLDERVTLEDANATYAPVATAATIAQQRIDALRLDVAPTGLPAGITVGAISSGATAFSVTPQQVLGFDTSVFRYSACRIIDQGLHRQVTDGVTNTTTTFTSATAAFTSADVGKSFSIIGGGGIPSNTRIASVTNATTVILSAAATASATGQTAIIGGPSVTAATYLPLPPTSGVEQAQPYVVDFMMDAPYLELEFRVKNSKNFVQMWIDGREVVPQTYRSDSLETTLRIGITDADRKPRHVKVRLRGMSIYRIRKLITDSVWRPSKPLYSARGYFLGDSFSASANDSLGRPFAMHVADILGWECLVGGESGTGYTNAGSGGADKVFLDRILSDLVPTNPDFVVIVGGYNDTNPTTTGAAATTIFDLLAQQLPGVPVFVFGPQYPSSTVSTVRDNISAALKTACDAAPNVKLYNSTKGWISGAGNTGSRAVTDAVTNSTTTLTSSNANFTSDDVGCFITGSGIPAGAKINSMTNESTVILSAAATATASGVSIVITEQRGDGTGDVYISPDATHPSDLGHRYYGGRIAQEIAAVYATA